MATKISKHRNAAYHRQGGRCCYCGRPMYRTDGYPKRGDLVQIWGLTKAQAKGLRCTAEHVVRKADGGSNVGNIKAACESCNTVRHETPPDVWAEVRAKLFEGWLEKCFSENLRIGHHNAVKRLERIKEAKHATKVRLPSSKPPESDEAGSPCE